MSRYKTEMLPGSAKSGASRFRPSGLYLLLLPLLLLLACSSEPSYDLLLRGGHVIDARNGIDSPMDIAVQDGRIVLTGENIDPRRAEQVIDATGLYVTPGLIDIHAHLFTGTRIGDDDGGFSGAFADGFSSVSPDNFALRNGITTMVDAGTSGWRNFPDFKRQVIDPSVTRVLAFLNIVGYGMRDHNHNQRIEDMDVERTVSMMEEHPDLIVGTKIGHFHGPEWVPFERAHEAAQRTGTPMILECHLPELPLRELLERIGPGDIVTHVYGDVHDRDSYLDGENRVRDYVMEAYERGVLFDVGHGGVSFHFHKAVPALEQGLKPYTFGSDLHRFSMNAGMKDMLNIMSKFMAMGMTLQEVIRGATYHASEAIRRPDLGHLSEGAVADIALIRLKEGEFGFVDSGGYRMDAERKLVAEMTIREGRIVWDLNGLASPLWNE